MTITDPSSGVERFAVVPAAYVFLLRDAGTAGTAETNGGVTEVLLQLRRGTGYMDGHWAAAAAGHVERGETAMDAARREALEEIGVVVAPADLGFVTAMQRTGGGAAIDERIDFFFTARRWRGQPTLREPDKAAELAWCRLDALPDPVVPHERDVLRTLHTGMMTPYRTFGFPPPDEELR